MALSIRSGLRGLALVAGLALATSTSTQAEDLEASARKAQPACDRAQFRVVVDVGHTVDSEGATSARGATEYGYNFFLAKQIELALHKAGFSHASMMVTSGKAKPSLFTRVARANRTGANLLLSIHHDAVPDKFVEYWQHDGRKWGFSDRFKGHSIFISNANADRAGSFLFARLLGQELKTRDLQYTPHYTEKFMGSRRRDLLDPKTGVYSYDKLIVLKNTSMPAVLLEAGSIVNRDEELVMASEERQLVVSSAVTNAVEAFCTARAGHKPELVAQATHKIADKPYKVARNSHKPRSRHAAKPAKRRVSDSQSNIRRQ